jgi:hypothetical protein
VSFAYVNVVRNRREVRTIGMHVMGLPDIVMQLSDTDDDGQHISAVIRHLCRGEKLDGDGHVLAGQAGPWLPVAATDDDQWELASPMRNPFGRLKRVSSRDAAEHN